MKKSFLLIFLIFLLAACGNVAEFEAELQSADDIARDIANYLAGFGEIDDCNVQIDGAVAVIGLDLACEMADMELIALKKRIAAEVKSRNVSIKRVAVNTAPDMLERVQGENVDGPNDNKNDSEEIFVNVAPTI